MKKILILIFLSFILFILIPLPELSLPYGTILYDKNGKIIYSFLSDDQQWRFELEEKNRIPEKIKNTIIISEDRRYYFHPGFDPVSFLRAIYINLKYKRFQQGGSTITMQTIRILDPKPRKILIKIKEIIQALKLELIYPKEKILKLYLSIAPMGGNISGMRAGSLRYFGKDIEDLTWAECATLVAILKSPSNINLWKNRVLLKEKRDLILKQLLKYKFIDKNTFFSSILEPVPSKTFEFPKNAPHFSFYLKKQNIKRNVKTTLDLNIQNKIETIGENNYYKIKSFGINSYSIIVLDTKEGKILGYVGSPSFYDKKEGQVDGVQAPRSTGSILKPFLYGLYLDQGMGTEETLLCDFPIHFGDFNPENSGKTYKGAVPLKEALISSLNIPAVWVLHKYGYENFYNFLKKAEISTLSNDPSRYGLSLIIGGAEGKLSEMTNLFRILSNGGQWSPYIFQEAKNKKEKKLLSKGSSYIIYNILQELKRPEAIYYSIYPEKNKFAWKTGTSFKQRDGWAIGTNSQYTIGVWVGNFSGEGNQNIMGASLSGPILFQIFSSLPENKDLKIKEDGLKKVLICKASGLGAKDECENLDFELIPEDVKKIPLCPYHKNYYIDPEKNQIVCSSCWQGLNPIKKTFFLLTPKMKYYGEMAGIKCDDLPSHNPLCNIKQSGILKIIYPEEGSTIKIPKEYDGNFQKIILKASSSSNEKEINWLLDKSLIGKTKSSHNLNVEIKEGEHFLQVIDEDGNTSSVHFNVLKSTG